MFQGINSEKGCNLNYFSDLLICLGTSLEVYPFAGNEGKGKEEIEDRTWGKRGKKQG